MYVFVVRLYDALKLLNPHSNGERLKHTFPTNSNAVSFLYKTFWKISKPSVRKMGRERKRSKVEKSQSAVCDVELQAPKENEMIQDSFSWAITTRERVTLHIARALTSNQVLRINVKHMHNFYATQPIVVRVRRCLHFAWLDFIPYCLRFAGSSLFSLFFHFSRFACLLFSSKFIILILCCILSGLFSIHCHLCRAYNFHYYSFLHVRCSFFFLADDFSNFFLCITFCANDFDTMLSRRFIAIDPLFYSVHL